MADHNFGTVKNVPPFGRGGQGGSRGDCPSVNNATPPHPPLLRGGVSAADALPCIHRGEIVRHVTCGLCGRRGKRVDVYACKVHGECTLSRWGTSREAREMARCVGCEQRVRRVES